MSAARFGAHYIGLMSGTSLDGIDGVVVSRLNHPKLIAQRCDPFPPDLRTLLASMADQSSVDWTLLGRAHIELAQCYAQTVRRLLADAHMRPSQIKAIGSHGQTVHHAPSSRTPFTVQLGDGSTLARETGITVVTDFRSGDIAAGGEGAPLVPAFHTAWLAHRREARVVLNLGGFANLSILPRLGSRTAVTGFDVGPANRLSDLWYAEHHGSGYDALGLWARGGIVRERIVETALADRYFKRSPPKSTGREYFSRAWLTELLAGGDDCAQDVQASLVEITARSIADAIHTHAPQARRVIGCGGGMHNSYLIERISALIAPLPLHSSAEFGIDPDWVEATAFAWLAKRRLQGRAGNLPAVTGAQAPAILGALYARPPRRQRSATRDG